MVAGITSLTRAQMAEMDMNAVKSGVPVRGLMEQAGMMVAEAAAEMLHNNGDVLVCAGKGNNGGDALCAARHLKEMGFGVEVLHPFPESEFKEEAGKQLGMLKKMGIRNSEFMGAWDKKRKINFSGFDLVIDGLLGFNLEGDPRGKYAELIEAMNKSGKKVLAVDLPSGLDADTGKPGNPCVRAAATITFALPKKGLMGKRAKEFTGKIYLGDIGMPAELYGEYGAEKDELFRGKKIIGL